MKRPSIAIVGAGRLGVALAVRLAEAGYEIREIVGRRNRRSHALPGALKGIRNIRVSSTQEAGLDADLTWLCVPDAMVAKTALDLATHDWRGKSVFHSSGVLSSDSLAALRNRGATVASVHPLMTFVHGSLPELSGVSFAIEGDLRATRVAKRVARDLGGESFVVRAEHKPAYHAFASMICPLLVSLLAAAENAAALAGVSAPEARRRMMPIIRQTLNNYAQLGPAASFSGPVVRGDVGTIRLHLQSLRKTPEARRAYAALIGAATEYLPARNAAEIRELLDGVIPGKIRRNARRKRPATKHSTRRS